MLLDVDYILLGTPGIALSLWAQWRIVSACSVAGRVPCSSGCTGAEAAQRLMRATEIESVQIEEASGQLANHYDPRRRVLRLHLRFLPGGRVPQSGSRLTRPVTRSSRRPGFPR